MSDTVSLSIRMWASSKKRDKVMEKVILNLGWEYYSASKAVEYARKVIKGRWIEAEPIIKKVPYQSYLYARHVIGGRWPEAENTIAKESGSSYLYANYVLKDRFILGEKNSKIWQKDAYCIYLYSRYVLKGRWESKEKTIAKQLNKDEHCWDVESVLKYCINVRKERWPEVEAKLAQSRQVGKYYHFLQGTDQEEFYNMILAQSIAGPADKWQINYAQEFIKGLKKAG